MGSRLDTLCLICIPFFKNFHFLSILLYIVQIFSDICEQKDKIRARLISSPPPMKTLKFINSSKKSTYLLYWYKGKITHERNRKEKKKRKWSNHLSLPLIYHSAQEKEKKIVNLNLFTNLRVDSIIHCNVIKKFVCK